MAQTSAPAAPQKPADTLTSAQLNDSMRKLETELLAKYGESQKARLSTGLHQVIQFWRPEDGDAGVFEAFVRTNFAGDQDSLDTMFDRYQRLLEQLDGHMHEISREFATQQDLDLGPIRSYDEIFGGYDPSAHVIDDFFQNKLAFIALLNFPLTSLEERINLGPKWTRRQWAEARLAERFSKRIPANVNLAIAQAGSDAANYIASYNIWMYHLVDDKGQRLFPPKMRLLSHWNLRDEIKSDYADQQNGLAKQRVIQHVMERIVIQSIPQSVVDNPHADWNPFTNEVKSATTQDSDTPAKNVGVTNTPEPDTRYATLLKTYRASRMADPSRPLPQRSSTAALTKIVKSPKSASRRCSSRCSTSPLVPQVAKLIETRLGRPLEPFDVGTRASVRAASTARRTRRRCREKFRPPRLTRKTFHNLLVKLGFSSERARYVADHIVVEAARGSGHAHGGRRCARRNPISAHASKRRA